MWTVDETSGKVLQYPANELWAATGEDRYAYLRLLADSWQVYPVLAVDKCRRMLLTWTFLALYLYDTLTRPHHANFVGSRKLEASAYLLGHQRLYGMYERIPADVWPDKPHLDATGKHGLGYTTLVCPETQSTIQAIASGADQLRQYTASNVLMDEYAFWDRAEESWTAILPTIQGGGHVHMISTPELGAYMYDLVYGGAQ